MQHTPRDPLLAPAAGLPVLPQREPSLQERALEVWEHHKVKIIAALLIILVIYLFFIRTGILGREFRALRLWLEDLNRNHGFLVFCLLYLIVVVVTCTMIFSHAALCMLTAGILNNFPYAVTLLILASLTASAIIYYLARPLCAEFILSKIEHMDFYQVLKKESVTNPWSTAFGTRFLFIPAGSKDYILTMIHNPPVPFFVSSFCIHMFYIIESCLIADQINEAGNEHGKPWSQKTAVEKFFQITIYLIIVFTIVFIVYLGNYVSKKIAEKKAEMAAFEMTTPMAQP